MPDANRAAMTFRPRLLFVLCAVLAGGALARCGDDETKKDGARRTDAPYGGKDAPYGGKDAPYGGKDAPYAGKDGAPRAGGVGANLEKRIDEALAKGLTWLLSQQDESGGWGDPEAGRPVNVGYTAMAAAAVVGATPRERVAADESVKKALAWLAGQQQENGAIADNPGLTNYMTSASIGAFDAAKLADYRQHVTRARDWLVQNQFQDDPEALNYGAFPYSSKSPRPADLSNAQFAATALAQAGLPKDHEVWKRLIAYLGKVQNRSETNSIRVEREVDGGKTGTVVSGDDGGSAYAPGLSYAGWEAKDGEDGEAVYVPKSYGSMTYALVKCLLLAGVDPKDPRVVEALAWLAKNFTMDHNPGMPPERAQQAYYYYVFTAARTLDAYEDLVRAPLPVEGASGAIRDWRAAVADALLERQTDGGWWMNDEAERWDEDSKVLVTSYAMQALAIAKGRMD